MTAKDNKTAADGIPAFKSASTEEDDEQAQRVPGYASQAGSFLAGSVKSDVAASMARGMATGEAGWNSSAVAEPLRDCPRSAGCGQKLLYEKLAVRPADAPV